MIQSSSEGPNCSTGKKEKEKRYRALNFKHKSNGKAKAPKGKTRPDPTMSSAGTNSSKDRVRLRPVRDESGSAKYEYSQDCFVAKSHRCDGPNSGTAR